MSGNPFAANNATTKEVPAKGGANLPPWLQKGAKHKKKGGKSSKEDMMAAIRARMAAKKKG